MMKSVLKNSKLSKSEKGSDFQNMATNSYPATISRVLAEHGEVYMARWIQAFPIYEPDYVVGGRRVIRRRCTNLTGTAPTWTPPLQPSCPNTSSGLHLAPDDAVPMPPTFEPLMVELSPGP